MKTTITIPEKQSEQEVLYFRLTPNNRYAMVAVKKGAQTAKMTVNLLPLLKNATGAQKTVIAGFFKLIGVEALKQFNEGLELTAADLDGELFNETEPEVEV